MVDNNQSDSSTEDIKPDDSANDLGDGTETGEEGDIAERGKGKRNAESRIDELTKEKYELASSLKATQDKVAELEERLKPPSTTQTNPTTAKAVEYLKSLGFTQKSDVEAELQTVRDRMALDTEHSRLRNEYDGGDGRPAYNQAEIEKYMRENGVYNPEVAYKALHETELLDWAMKKANSKEKVKPYIEKPGSTSGSREDDTITREKLEEWMKTPEGRMKYEENRPKILQLMSEGKL